MMRTRWVVPLSAAALIVASAVAGLARDPAAPPAGLKILYSGDSWHRFMPGLMDRIGAAAGITDQKVDTAWAKNTGGYDKLGKLDEGAYDCMSWGRPSWADDGVKQFLSQGVGEAVTRLRSMISEGKVPGVEKQSQVFAAAMPHAGPLAAELAAYCNYAAIYRRSPEGLAIKDGATTEQQAILQRIAWETVSKYPYAGVAPKE